MQFISFKDNKFEVTEQARALLSGPWADISLSVVSVVGTYRIGKSSLLNWLTGKIDLFPTSDEVHAKTRGLWMAKELHNDSILFIDSEGLSNVEVSTEYDFKIFALCIALSSKLIINTEHVLKSNELVELQQAAKMSKLLSSNAEIKNGSPDLLWLFRNSQLKITDQGTGEPISATKYLENSLLKLDPQLSQVLLELFPKRYAIALPKPSNIDIDIKNQNFRNFTPSFKNAFDLVKQEIEEQTHPKLIGEVSITGSLFLMMAEKLCEDKNDLSSVYESLKNETRLKIDNKIAIETKKLIGIRDKKRSLFHDDLYFTLPPFIIKNIKKLLLEDPDLDKIAELLEICLKTIKDQEKLQLNTFVLNLKKELNSIDEVVLAIINYFSSTNIHLLDVYKWIKDTSISTEKCDLLQQDIIEKQIQITKQQKEIEILEETLKTEQEEKQDNQVLIQRLKLELSLLSNKLLENENEFNQIKTELNANNESIEQYMMIIKELKTRCEIKNEDKLKLEQTSIKYQKDIEDSQIIIKKNQIELESKKQMIDELQEKLKDYNKKIELLHLDIVNEKARSIREEERSTKRLKFYQDASAQHTVDINELQSLKHQKIADTNKIAELTGSLLTAKRMQSFHELVKHF